MLLRMSLVVAAIASLSMVGQSRAQELLGSEHVLPIVEMRNAGTFELQPDGSLRRVLTPISDEDVVWFESMNSALSFFHIGEMQDPPSGIPMSESVSHGDGLSTEGGTVCGFTMTYATSQRTGSLDVIVTYYDDGDAGETPSPVAAAFLISDLPKPEPDDPVGAFGFVVTVTLPESLHFNISTDEFQYGSACLRATAFGPTFRSIFLVRLLVGPTRRSMLLLDVPGTSSNLGSHRPKWWCSQWQFLVRCNWTLVRECIEFIQPPRAKCFNRRSLRHPQCNCSTK